MWFKVLAVITILLYSSAEVAVLILARGGSKGVRLKNLQKVGGTSLLSRAIHTAKAAGFHDVTVSTDNPIIALESIKGNATVFHRSFVTATDWAPSIWGALEFLSSRPNVTILILLQVTSPFTQPTQLRRAFDKIARPVPFDCVFSATRSYKLRWQFIKGQIYPANFQVDDRVRRQDWNGEFLETGAFYITRRWLLDMGKFQNNNFGSWWQKIKQHQRQHSFLFLVLLRIRVPSLNMRLSEEKSKAGLTSRVLDKMWAKNIITIEKIWARRDLLGHVS